MKSKLATFNKISIFLVALIIAGFLHGYNMFHFPYYESDEGTYTSQAWSIITEHKITPYTYWYDHPPMGWSLLAGWFSILPKKFSTFGTSLDTGRVFMLIIHLITAYLIFIITNKITKKNLPALLAVIIFSISPLAIYFQRRILLDNIMTMWLLMSVAILYTRHNKIKLTTYVFSGLFFALAVLTKITAVVFGPALLYLVWTHYSPIKTYFRNTTWLTVGILTVSIYLLIALLRGEFFIGNDHVSFLGALKFQSSRSGGVFWQNNSAFYIAIQDWFKKDMGLMYIIFGTGLLSMIFIWFKKNIIFFVLAIVLYIFFLARGGIIINFYILPLIPFVSILSAIISHYIAKTLTKNIIIYQLFFITIIGGLFFYYYQYASHDVFFRDATNNQKIAINWIKKNLSPNKAILIDIYSFTDLHNPNYLNNKNFYNADWYYKVSRDKEVGKKKYNNNWRNFDYIMLTHEMLKQIKDGDDNFIKIAFQNSLPVKKWTKNTHAFVDEQKFISTDGDWVMLFKINDNTQTELFESWKKYKKLYIHSYGQVIDPETVTTNIEGQSLTMLKAVLMHDREIFKGVWAWTKDHLQSRVQDKLFSQEWAFNKVGQSDNISNADGDIALALLFAYQEWGEEEYLDDAQEIINDIWKQEVRNINGFYYLLATNELSATKTINGEIWYAIKPAYFSPAWYRIFSEVDRKHNWNKLANDSYLILNKLQLSHLNESIFPEEYLVNQKTGEIQIVKEKTSVTNNQHNSFLNNDKFLFFWRIAMDLNWFNPNNAREYINHINNYLGPIIKDNKNKLEELNNPEQKKYYQEKIPVQFGYSLALMWNKENGQLYYDNYILPKYDYHNKIWKDSQNQYISDTWGWFVMATYNNKIPNLWKKNILTDY